MTTVANDLDPARVDSILGELNERQADAVSAKLGNYLVVAGAGSGKTRVLTHRVAWLVEVEDVRPHAILAVTFTNKAAGEMRNRIEGLLDGRNTRGLTVGTFHAICHRMLRIHHEAANLTRNFSIIDSDDQKRVIKRVLNDLEMDPQAWPPSNCASFINARKDKGLRARDSQPDSGDFLDVAHHRVYTAYEGACQHGHFVDFGELLLRAHELLRDNPDVRAKYQGRFKQILVDEFQDTNTIQYRWLRQLAGDTGQIMAVGDDDQSIYGWRGARVENLQKFLYDFDNVGTVRLEQNYRSTNNILKAANVLIENNTDRLGKNLWSDGEAGEKIGLFEAFDGEDEAGFIAATIKKRMVDSVAAADDFAVLYRTNAQSRPIEQALIANKIPYRIHGGLRFFERAEVRNALAYMRLILDPNADGAFERVVNTPSRRVGHAAVDAIRSHAGMTGLSLWGAAGDALDKGLLPGRAAGPVRRFLETVDDLRTKADGASLPEIAALAVRDSGLLEFHSMDREGKGETRAENLGELVNAAGQFEVGDEYLLDDEDPREDDDLLDLFLTQTVLDAGDTGDAPREAVQLMTIHAAKGLEFPVVFLSGLEEPTFPSANALREDPAGGLAEERRLCYVGITRAMNELFLSHAEERRVWGRLEEREPSRFLDEVPDALTREVRHTRRRPSRQQGYSYYR